MIEKFVCWLIGHKKEDYCESIGAVNCLRCGFEIYPEDKE